MEPLKKPEIRKVQRTSVGELFFPPGDSFKFALIRLEIGLPWDPVALVSRLWSQLLSNATDLVPEDWKLLWRKFMNMQGCYPDPQPSAKSCGHVSK